MASAKDITLKPIPASRANPLMKELHYSGKVVPNSQLHIGVFLHGKLEGAMQFGPPMDKRKMLPLVEDTDWNGMMELNRMAFSDNLPRNSESRAIAVAMKLMKEHAPHVEWILSFADATQCGDGTIYRAAGFVLTGIRENKQMIRMPDGEVIAQGTITRAGKNGGMAIKRRFDEKYGTDLYQNTSPSVKQLLEVGGEWMEGYQLRYIYFINPEARERLTVPVIPFERIDDLGAGMYRGEKVTYEERNTEQSAPEA
jgi:hypothetical protein